MHCALRMIGRSIFHQWGTPKWEGITVSNLAVSGTTAQYWAQNIQKHLSADVLSYAVYCGSNDLNQDAPAHDVTENIARVLQAIRGMGPNHRVAYLSIMKAPQKQKKFSIIDQINDAIRLDLTDQDLYVDLNSIVGQNPQWYVEDNLHLTTDCYAEIESRIHAKMSNWCTQS